MKSLDWNKGKTLLSRGKYTSESTWSIGKLMSGIYTPWEFLNSISRSLSKTIVDDSSIVYVSDYSDMREEEQEQECKISILPCKHSNCCEQCTQTIPQMGNTCPTCRTPIVDTFQIFLS